LTHLDELLSAYLDGETTSAESALVSRHLGDCGRCQRHLAEVSAARAAVRSLPMLELPLALLRVPAPSVPLVRRRSLWLGATAAAAAVVITVSSLLTPAPQPISLSDISLQIGARAALDAGSATFKVTPPGAAADQ
jgi:anti-sigma factor RsiW